VGSKAAVGMYVLVFMRQAMHRSLMPRAHWQLYLRNYLVARMEPTDLYDSARIVQIFCCGNVSYGGTGSSV
jgi:hypothetical protein